MNNLAFIKYNFIAEYPIESYKWNDTLDQLQRVISDIYGNNIAGIEIKTGLVDNLIQYFQALSMQFYSAGSPNIKNLEKLADSITVNFDYLREV